MFGVRRQIYEYDINLHNQTWPSYEEFLHLQSWEHITDEDVRHALMKRADFDPVYHKSLMPSLKQPWTGMEIVRENYSQSWQDWFVLTMLNGKKDGHWLELGCSDPIYMNNTYLLESQFAWQGISIDFRDKLVSEWTEIRSAPLHIRNALDTNWHTLLLDSPRQIDYLQVDLSDWATLECLEKLPHDRYRFSVITFEHDIFQADSSIRRRSSEFLTNLGYQLVIGNVAVKNYATQTWEPFEDWWIDPHSIDPDVVANITDISEEIKIPHWIFINP